MGLKSTAKKLEYNRRRYQEKKAEILKKQKAAYERDKPRILARIAAYKAEHGDPTASERSRRYEERNRAERNASKRAWRLAHPGAAYAALKRYVKKKPQVKSHWDAARRARENGAGGSHTLQQWEEKQAEYDHRCAYCRRKAKLVRDHAIPIARGGSHKINNILPACVRCNSQKRALTESEYRQQFIGAQAC